MRPDFTTGAEKLRHRKHAIRQNQEACKLQSKASTFVVGDLVEYNSTTHSRWIPATVIGVEDGGYRLDMRPDFTTASEKLRRRQSATKQDQAIAPTLTLKRPPTSVKQFGPPIVGADSQLGSKPEGVPHPKRILVREAGQPQRMYSRGDAKDSSSGKISSNNERQGSRVAPAYAHVPRSAPLHQASATSLGSKISPRIKEELAQQSQRSVSPLIRNESYGGLMRTDSYGAHHSHGGKLIGTYCSAQVPVVTRSHLTPTLSLGSLNPHLGGSHVVPMHSTTGTTTSASGFTQISALPHRRFV